MVSIRFIGVAVLVATTVAVSATTSAPAFPTPPTAVARQAGDATVDLTEPEDLPFGDPPQVAYIDGMTRDTPIYRPGKEPLAVGPGRLVRQLTQVRGGYVVTMSNLRRSWVQYVANDGRGRPLLRPHPPSFVGNTVASSDGRFVAVMVEHAGEPRSERMVVVRVSDGTAVARRVFTWPAVVASFTPRRAVLTTGWWNLPVTHPDRQTRWWNLRTGNLRLIDDAGRPSGRYDHVRSPADLTAGQVALVRGDHDRVAPLARRAGRGWLTAAHEWVLAWSPDDRYVLTATMPASPADRVGDGWNDIMVRRAHGGALVQRFHGYSNLYVGALWSPVWEGDDTFVFPAGYDCGGAVGEGFGCAGRTLVRCTVHQACEQVAVPAGVVRTDERQTPPS